MNIFAAANRMTDFAAARRHMVDGQVRTADVTDLRILAAMSEIPRERFVPPALAGLAYLDLDVPVGAAPPPAQADGVRQAGAGAPTLSGERARARCRRAGGYGAAVLARLAGQVVALEEDASLAASAQAALADAPNVTVVERPATGGLAAGRALRRHPAGRRG